MIIATAAPDAQAMRDVDPKIRAEVARAMEKARPAIRKAIYTTNSVEALHRSLRKIIKTRGAFPNEESALKLLFLAIRQASKKWTMPVQNWSQALNYFTVLWPERMSRPGRLA